MTHILHILKKDLRRYTWAWMSLILLGAMQVYLQGTTTGMLETKLNQTLAILTSMVSALLFVLVIVMVVQEENLADPDAYWLARPIARGKLLAEKLIFVAFLCAIFTASEATILVLNDGLHRLGYQLLGIIPAVAMALGYVFLAAQTRSLPRFLLLVVCLLVGFTGFTLVVAFADGFADSIFDQGLLPADLDSHTLALIQTVYWFIVGIGILTVCYLSRRILIAWLLVFPALWGSILLTPSDSFFGNNFEFSQDNPIQLGIDHIRTTDSAQTGGDEYIALEAVFHPIENEDEHDLWISVQSINMNVGRKEINLRTMSMSQRLWKRSDGKYYARIGSIKRSDLDAVGEDVDLHMVLRITESTQEEAGRLMLHEGETYVGNGNRLIVRSIYRSSEESSVYLAGVLPELSFEPRPIQTRYEAFQGQYSFALASRYSTALTVDFDLSPSHEGFGAAQVAQLKVTLPQSEPLFHYEVVIYKRQVISHSWNTVFAKNITIVRE
jgi:hypothetical protein